MAKIHYLLGDATVPQAKGKKIIAHVCNDQGKWGKGFVMAISDRWMEPETEYRAWHKMGDGFSMGAVQFVRVDPHTWVANMIGQRGTKTGSKGPPGRYDAIKKALTQVAVHAADVRATVHMPRIGCGLAGGTWDQIEPLIESTLIAAGIDTYVYDFGDGE